MKIIGFNFNKIKVEKKNNDLKGLKIKNSIDLLKVDSVKNEMIGQGEELIGVEFKFTVDYSNDMAKLELGGSVLLALESKEAKKMVKEWKDKNLSDEFKVPLFNLILRKSNIKALVLEDEMNLPLHVKLPFLQKEE